MRVTVLYFGVLKDMFGGSGGAVDLAEGETVGGLLRLSQESASKQSETWKAQSEIWRALAVAVNREYAVSERVLRDGDEVALLPPVSGGVRA